MVTVREENGLFYGKCGVVVRTGKEGVFGCRRIEGKPSVDPWTAAARAVGAARTFTDWFVGRLERPRPHRYGEWYGGHMDRPDPIKLHRGKLHV